MSSDWFCQASEDILGVKWIFVICRDLVDCKILHCKLEKDILTGKTFMNIVHQFDSLVNKYIIESTPI